MIMTILITTQGRPFPRKPVMHVANSHNISTKVVNFPYIYAKYIFFLFSFNWVFWLNLGFLLSSNFDYSYWTPLNYSVKLFSSLKHRATRECCDLFKLQRYTQNEQWFQIQGIAPIKATHTKGEDFNLCNASLYSSLLESTLTIVGAYRDQSRASKGFAKDDEVT